MTDLLVDLEDEAIHTLLHRAERNGRSLNDEMLAILSAAAGGESLPDDSEPPDKLERPS